jgi:hypothetical protein
MAKLTGLSSACLIAITSEKGDEGEVHCRTLLTQFCLLYACFCHVRSVIQERCCFDQTNQIPQFLHTAGYLERTAPQFPCGGCSECYFRTLEVLLTALNASPAGNSARRTDVAIVELLRTHMMDQNREAFLRTDGTPGGEPGRFDATAMSAVHGPRDWVTASIQPTGTGLAPGGGAPSFCLPTLAQSNVNKNSHERQPQQLLDILPLRINPSDLPPSLPNNMAVRPPALLNFNHANGARSTRRGRSRLQGMGPAQDEVVISGTAIRFLGRHPGQDDDLGSGTANPVGAGVAGPLQGDSMTSGEEPEGSDIPLTLLPNPGEGAQELSEPMQQDGPAEVLSDAEPGDGGRELEASDDEESDEEEEEGGVNVKVEVELPGILKRGRMWVPTGGLERKKRK